MKKIPPPHTKLYVRHELVEVVELEFLDGTKKKIETLKCNIHKQCSCGVNSMMDFLKKMKRDYIKQFGPIVKITPLITREIKGEITTYGPLNIQDELNFFEEYERLGRKSRDKLIKKYGSKINAAPESPNHFQKKEYENSEDYIFEISKFVV